MLSHSKVKIKSTGAYDSKSLIFFFLNICP
jgi:hypothetical protein